MHLPASSFAKCSAAPPPSNTVFPDVSVVDVTFKDMERYLPLVLALYDSSPMGSLNVRVFIFFPCAWLMRLARKASLLWACWSEPSLLLMTRAMVSSAKLAIAAES